MNINPERSLVNRNVQNNTENKLVKIGTGWIFNIEKNIGYKVLRKGNQRTGEVENFQEAFYITKTGNKENFDIKYQMEVPAGVVRKALKLIQWADN